MRRKDNKRVLTGRSNNNKNNRNSRSKMPLIKRHRSQSVPVRQRRENKKTNKVLLLLIIVALVAFVIGAGLGISMSFDNNASSEETPEYENVTVEMTSNLNETEPVYFDSELDAVDYNDQQDLENLNVTNETTTLNY